MTERPELRQSGEQLNKIRDKVTGQKSTIARFEMKAVKRRRACLCVWWLYNSGRPWLVTVNDSNDDSL